MDLSPSSFTHFLQNQGLERKREQFVQLNPFSQWILNEIHLLLKGSGTACTQELAKSSLRARRRHRDATVSGRDRQAGRNLKERNKNDQGLEGLIY